MSNLNLIVSLISDSVNGLIEIHFDNKELAEQALQNYIDDGAEINAENGMENARETAESFFHIEHHEITSFDELYALHEEYSNQMLDIRAEAIEKLDLEG